MNKLKGFTMATLGLALAVTTAACGKTSTPSAPGTSPNASVKPTDDKPKSDLGGRTIRIAAWWNDTPKADSETGKALLAKIQDVEKKYNCKIEYVNVPYNDYVKKFTTSVLAGQPFADIVRLQYDWALVATTQGQLMKLNDFISIGKSKVLKKGFPLKGDDYAFDTIGGTDDAGVLYNRELFKKLGLTDPQDLYAQGKWNWDEFEKIAKQATQDTNNDGKPDTYGWAGWDTETGQFLIASNGGMISDDKAGKETLSDPKTIEALDFENKLYNVDHVVKVKSGNVDEYKERTTFADGDVAMTYGWGWETDQYKKANIDYGYVPFPKGPKGTDNLQPVTAGHAWFISKGVENPRVVAQIYEEMKDVPSKEAYLGQDWLESHFKTQKDIDIIRKQAGKTIFMNYGAYPNYPYNSMVSDIIKNQVPAASAAEKVKQAAQASIDKILKAQ